MVASLELGTIGGCTGQPSEDILQERHLPHASDLQDFTAHADPNGWRAEGRDLLRAIAAGSIIGMPLLYTMEMWWRGATLAEWHLLLLLGASLVINFFFSLFCGFRHRFSAGEAAAESVTAVALGMLFSVGILWLIGEITFDRAWSDVLGRVLVEAAPVSLGISFANHQMRNKNGDDEDDDGALGAAKTGDDPERLQLRQDLTDLAATVGGATLFAYNVAPTEEIAVIAARMAKWQQLLTIGVSLLLC